MKYLYKQTGLVVESSVMLDSLLFELVEEKTEAAVQKETEPVKKTTRKATTKTTK